MTTVLFVLTTAGIVAQQQTASLTGQVTDSSGAVIPGALVTITDADRGTKTTATTDSRGVYTIPQLPPAEHYHIIVDKPGFKQMVQENVVLQVAQSAKIDFKVTIGNVSETIDVSSAPPQLDTQSSSLGQVITGDTIEALPLNGRSSFRLIALTPGVNARQAGGSFGDVPVNSTVDTNFSINGGRQQSNEILIDGVPSSSGFFDQITTIPIVDETQEFKVESNNLSSVYGRYSGGVINVTTKSGANDIHGDAFEFIRNDAFDANDWFNNRAGIRRAGFHMNQFGGTLGGPVTLPHLYNGHDRTFFFVSYQGTRRTKGTPYSGALPTAAMRAGDFSAVCYNAGGAFNVNGLCSVAAGQIYNPFTTATSANGTKTRTAFANNMIPASLFDPVALKMAAYFPLPNSGTPGAITNNFISNSPVIVTQDIVSGRIDQNISQKYHLSGRYAFSSTPLTQPNIYNNVASTGPSAVGTTPFRNQSFALNNLYVFSPTLLVNVNYGYARWFQSRQTRSYGFDNSTLGFPSSFVSAITIPMFPGVSIAGYSGLATQNYLRNGNDSHALIVSATKILGKHNLTVGVDGRLFRINLFSVDNTAGAFNFAIAQTSTGTTNVGGNGFASFLLGTGSGGSFPVASGSELQDMYGAIYLQDDFRVTPRLTLNLGVRYDGESPYADRHNQLNYFDPSITSPARNSSFPSLTGGLVFAETNGGPRTVYTRQHNNVAPRVGFAFNPQPTTVVHGGFGISYAPLELSNNAVGFVPTLGYASSTTWNTSNDGGFTPANLLRNPYPQGFVQPNGSSLGAGTQLGQAITVWAHNPPTPYAMQWNFGVQQQLARSLLLDIAYSASRGEHLTAPYARNTLDPKYLSLAGNLTKLVANPFQPYVSIGTLANATVAQRQLLLPFPQFLGVTEVNSSYGDSNYHSLQAKLVQRMSHGVTILAAYTWSKQISNADVRPITSTSVQNYYDLRAERSVSELDQPQNLVINGVAELPIGRGKPILGRAGPGLNKLVGGWKVTSILTEQSGFPLSLTAVSVGAGTRPNLVPGVDPRINVSRPNTQRVQSYFNTAAFVAPPAYTFGTVGRTFPYLRGPGIQNLDSSLEKITKFERVTTEFRAEAFNVTNTPHFGQPNTAQNSLAFGTITSVLLSPPQRELQLALKILF